MQNKLSNELIIKIINYCDNNTLLKLKILEEFNIFKKDIDKNIYNNSIVEWQKIQYNYIKNHLKDNIFEKMRINHIVFNFNYHDFKRLIINCSFDNYKIIFDNYWNNEIDIYLDSNNFTSINIEKIIILLKKDLPLLRAKYNNYIYRFPSNVPFI
jgi:hypothetical protein